MKTKHEFQQKWDDIVFENRNQQYGAYVLRQSYNGNLGKSFMVSISVVVLATFVAFNFKNTPNVPGVVPKDPPIVWNNNDIVVIPVKKQETPIVNTVKRILPDVYKPVTQDVVDTPVEDQPDVQSTQGVEAGDYTDVSAGTTVGVDTDIAGSVITEPVKPFRVVEEMPVFEGLNKFLQKKLRYPTSAQRNEIEGTVFVQFIIDPAGQVTNVTLVKGFDADCDREALRVVSSMPLWKPGKQQQVAVPVIMVLPIKFKLGKV